MGGWAEPADRGLHLCLCPLQPQSPSLGRAPHPKEFQGHHWGSLSLPSGDPCQTPTTFTCVSGGTGWRKCTEQVCVSVAVAVNIQDRDQAKTPLYRSTSVHTLCHLPHCHMGLRPQLDLCLDALSMTLPLSSFSTRALASVIFWFSLSPSIHLSVSHSLCFPICL